MIEAQFYWLNIERFGRSTYVLSHRMLFRIGEAYAVLDRHFYRSHDYNSLRQGTAALPTKDGMLVYFLSRVSTDQVPGEASRVSRPDGVLHQRPALKRALHPRRLRWGTTLISPDPMCNRQRGGAVSSSRCRSRRSRGPDWRRSRRKTAQTLPRSSVFTSSHTHTTICLTASVWIASPPWRHSP